MSSVCAHADGDGTCGLVQAQLTGNWENGKFILSRRPGEPSILVLLSGLTMMTELQNGSLEGTLKGDLLLCSEQGRPAGPG